MNKFLYLFSFTFLLAGCSAQAQMVNNDRNMTINMSATEQVPADLIIFNVNINASADTPQSVFELHQQRESILAELLADFDIEENDIRFQPVRIHKQNRNDSEDQYSRTDQQVSITFSDFEIYEKLQLKLIENGFDSFNAQFSTTQLEEAKQAALLSAIQAAKDRAELIAESAGVGLNRIVNISYSEHQVRAYQTSSEVIRLRGTSSASMMDFAQMVDITANITLTFEITNSSN